MLSSVKLWRPFTGETGGSFLPPVSCVRRRFASVYAMVKYFSGTSMEVEPMYLPGSPMI